MTDALFLEHIQKLEEFVETVDQYEKKFEESYNLREEIEKRKDTEYNLWQTIITSDIARCQSDIQSKQVSLQSLDLSYETYKTQQIMEEQKTIMSETECNKLRNKYDELVQEIDKQSFNHSEEHDIILGTSVNYGREIMIPYNVFSNILYYIDIQTIFIISRVCQLWNTGIKNWSGWKNGVLLHYWNNQEILFGYQNSLNREHTPSLGSTTSSSHTNDLYYQRFRRFMLSIETQKNNMYQIEVEGFSDINLPSQETAIQHDKSKRKVMLYPVEGNEQLAKEFSICDVILSNHQNLANIKATIARLQTRCESDKQTQKGYQIQTQNLTNNIAIVDKQVKELDLQQESDKNTIKFLDQQITTLQRTLDELKQIPTRLEEEESKLEKEFELKLKALNESGLIDLNQELLKLRQENETLATALKLEQANLQTTTQQRDDLKSRYEALKEEMTKALL